MYIIHISKNTFLHIYGNIINYQLQSFVQIIGMQIKMAILLNVTKIFMLKKTGKYGGVDLCLQALEGMVLVCVC